MSEKVLGETTTGAPAAALSRHSSLVGRNRDQRASSASSASAASAPSMIIASASAPTASTSTSVPMARKRAGGASAAPFTNQQYETTRVRSRDEAFARVPPPGQTPAGGLRTSRTRATSSRSADRAPACDAGDVAGDRSTAPPPVAWSVMRVAAMDLGSNSFHLLVADVHADGHIDPLVQEKEMLRLGDVVSRHGAIPLTAADQAIATVRRFRLLAEAAGATEILAKATAAIRRASNGGEVVDRIRAETGVHVDVIGGLEEARLIFGAVRASVVLDPSPALCFDLGGGSLEIMVGDASSLMWATSVPLGVARLTADFIGSDPISKRDRRVLREHIETVLAPVVTEVAGFEPKLAVGSSGTL